MFAEEVADAENESVVYELHLFWNDLIVFLLHGDEKLAVEGGYFFFKERQAFDDVAHITKDHGAAVVYEVGISSNLIDVNQWYLVF